MVTDRGRYLLDNKQAEAGQRFDALAALFSPSTFRHLEHLGISPGWRVWEAGAGSPGVPAWLAARVGPDGYVLATDIDTSWLGRVESDAYFPMGGPACSELERATVEQIRHGLVARGLATDTRIDQHLANVAAGQLDLATSPMVSAWGQRRQALRRRDIP